MFLRITLLIAVILIPELSSAEVSDKIPSISYYWIEATILSAILVAMLRIRWWLPIAVLPVTVILILGTLDVIADPFVGPAAREEQGTRYFVHAIATLSVVSIVQLSTIAFGIRGKLKSKAI